MARKTVVASTRIPETGPGVSQERVDAVALRLGLLNEDGTVNRSRAVRMALEELIDRHPVSDEDLARLRDWATALATIELLEIP